MASLADYKGSKFLSVGDHLVKVMDYKGVESPKSGNKGVEFWLEDAHGSGMRETFWLTEKAMWRLSAFADVCGISDEAKRAYDPFVFSNHRTLVNFKLYIRVVKGEKYNEVDEWWSVKEEAPAFKFAPSPDSAPQGPKDKDIPF